MLFLLMLLSVIVLANTDVVKKLKDGIIQAIGCVKSGNFSDIKIGIFVAVAFGFFGAFAFDIGIIQAIVAFASSLLGIEIAVEFTAMSHLFDLISCSLIISQGSGFIVDKLEEWKAGIDLIRKMK